MKLSLPPQSKPQANQQANQRTIIAITHDPDLASLADQVIMMKDGGLLVRGSFDQLLRENAEFRSVVNIEDAGAK